MPPSVRATLPASPSIESAFEFGANSQNRCASSAHRFSKFNCQILNIATVSVRVFGNRISVSVVVVYWEEIGIGEQQHVCVTCQGRQSRVIRAAEECRLEIPEEAGSDLAGELWCLKRDRNGCSDEPQRTTKRTSPPLRAVATSVACPNTRWGNPADCEFDRFLILRSRRIAGTSATTPEYRLDCSDCFGVSGVSFQSS